jgi:hypothetical protein
VPEIFSVGRSSAMNQPPYCGGARFSELLRISDAT